MSASTAVLNTAAGVPTGLITFISCHTAAPGSTGANEYAGVTRLAVTWGSASGGVIANTNALTFTTSGASAVTDFGGFTAVTAGTWVDSFHLSTPVTSTSITIAIGALQMAATG